MLAAGYAELAIDGGEVVLDGLGRHVHALRDLAVRLPVGGQRGDTALARGQGVDRPGRARARRYCVAASVATDSASRQIAAVACSPVAAQRRHRLSTTRHRGRWSALVAAAAPSAGLPCEGPLARQLELFWRGEVSRWVHRERDGWKGAAAWGVAPPPPSARVGRGSAVDQRADRQREAGQQRRRQRVLRIELERDVERAPGDGPAQDGQLARARVDEPQLRQAVALVGGLLRADVVAPRRWRATLDGERRNRIEGPPFEWSTSPTPARRWRSARASQATSVRQSANSCSSDRAKPGSCGDVSSSATPSSRDSSNTAACGDERRKA